MILSRINTVRIVLGLMVVTETLDCGQYLAHWVGSANVGAETRSSRATTKIHLAANERE